MNWLNTLAGFGVGMMVGLTGVGGGSLMTPILVLLFGIAPASAVGTDLWFAGLTIGLGLQLRYPADWSSFWYFLHPSFTPFMLTR